MSLNTKGKYGYKVTDTEIKWPIISKSVTIIIFVEFIDQLINYPISCASFKPNQNELCYIEVPVYEYLSKKHYGKCSKNSNTKVADKMTCANSADPDQTAPEGAVWSGSTLFAIPLSMLRNKCIRNII